MHFFFLLNKRRYKLFPGFLTPLSYLAQLHTCMNKRELSHVNSTGVLGAQHNLSDVMRTPSKEFKRAGISAYTKTFCYPQQTVVERTLWIEAVMRKLHATSLVFVFLTTKSLMTSQATSGHFTVHIKFPRTNLKGWKANDTPLSSACSSH